jgi:hypothetical protein
MVNGQWSMVNVQFRTLKIMTKEQYVTFSTAKMLSEYGFTWQCRCYYLSDGQRYEYCHQEDLPLRDAAGFSCPTQAMLMQWLRETYKIAVTPLPYRYPNKWKCMIVYLGVPMEQDDKFDICELGKVCLSFEEAAEAGIQYVLKNIVAKISKKKTDL